MAVRRIMAIKATNQKQESDPATFCQKAYTKWHQTTPPTCVSIGSILRDSHLDRQKKPGPPRQGRPSSCSSSETQNARRPPAKAARQQEENLMFISIRTQSIRLWTVIALLALI